MQQSPLFPYWLLTPSGGTWPTKAFYWLFGIFSTEENQRKIWSSHNLSTVFLGQQKKKMKTNCMGLFLSSHARPNYN